MSGCVLPQELLDKIIDALYKDLAALAACSLAGKTFVRARSHFFHTIIFRRNTSDSESVLTAQAGLCQKFHNLIVSSPHVKHLVRELVIVNSIRWVYSDSLFLPLVLDALADSSSNLKSFTIRGTRYSTHFWKFIPVRLQTSILQILQVHSLRHVTFYHVRDYPPSALTLFKNLESFAMVDSASVADFSEFPQETSSNCSRLQSLTITNFALDSPPSTINVALDSSQQVNPLLPWLYGPHSPFDLTTLKELHFESRTDEDMHLRVQSYPNLSHLKLHVIFDVTHPRGRADQPNIPTVFSRQPFKQIATQLIAMPLLSLKTIQIIIVVGWAPGLLPADERFPSSELTPMGSPASHWEALDAALISLPSLRQVRFVLLRHRHGPGSPEDSDFELNRALQSFFPKVSASGIRLDLGGPL